MLVMMLVGGVAWGQGTPTTKGSGRFIKEIEAFEAKDKKDGMPPAGGVLFVGSSTIRIWKVKEAFPGVEVINRGFGGSHISDSVEYADRIILPYKPRLIVFYAGDNDLAAGKSPARVAGDFKELMGEIRGALPETKVVFLAIKLCPSRWKFADKVRDTNHRIEEMAEKDPLLSVVSMEKEMLGEDGRPRKELFQKDGLHMSPAGYEIWNKKLGPIVGSAGSDR
jgi:lysophospholipase L1-like esterase